MYLGNFAIDYISDYKINHPEVYFTAFEKDYRNRAVEGFDINIENIAPEEIRINTAITHPQAKMIAIKIYDINQCIISDGAASAVLQYPQYSYGQGIPIQKMYIMVPSLQFYRPGDLPENFISGENYRICIAVLNDQGNVIYRWQEYVTIP
ncbi:MAG TPA: hypothetical protein VFC96_05720 [Anaerovoracaceae bacterium]|nr:hypothetical protein [Anaerovoracaceae bacterium]